MATNNFKAFALDPNANVMSQADWEALPALLSGFTAGKASSAQVNKAIRQATVIASVMAQYVSDSAVADVLDDGDTTALLEVFKTALSGRLIKTVKFTTSGAYSPSANAKRIRVRAIGGGGGGGGGNVSGSYGGGGGAGAYAEVMINTTGLALPVTITIGSGGAGSAITGSAGGITSFGSMISCPGGAGGNQGTVIGLIGGGAGGDLPTITLGTTILTMRGERGSAGLRIDSTAPGILGGNGASSLLGAGGMGIVSTTNSNALATGFGSGGGGNGYASVSSSGGNGAPGVVIIDEYF